MIHTGQNGKYTWLVSSSRIWTLSKLVLHYHRGLRVCISSFDSGPLTPTKEELEQGWSCQSSVAISPPIEETLDLPYDNHDEWFIVDHPNIEQENIETFVNYGTFTLRTLEEIYHSYDPTWEKRGFDWLPDVQERFWNQIQRIKPETYVAMGDNDVVVSQNKQFIDAVLASRP